MKQQNDKIRKSKVKFKSLSFYSRLPQLKTNEDPQSKRWGAVRGEGRKREVGWRGRDKSRS